MPVPIVRDIRLLLMSVTEVCYLIPYFLSATVICNRHLLQALEANIHIRDQITGSK